MDTADTAVAVRGRGITKVFGDVVALDHVDVSVARGQIHGLVGPNGAGKTTLLGLLLGLAAADEGTLEILGEPVGRGLPAPDDVSGFVDGPGLYPTLTARQNLATLAALRSDDGLAAGIGGALEQVGLAHVADDKVRGFSLGMRQRLGLAAALLTRPRLLVLDEPSNGLDPAGKRDVHGVLRRLAAEGVTVILSSHRMDDLEALCSEVTILATGRVVFSGPVKKLFDENRELDYRLRASDAAAARDAAAGTSGITVVADSDAAAPGDDEVLVVRGRVAALDELGTRIVRAGAAVRELAPVVSPLEAAFLALTEQSGDGGRNGQHGQSGQATAPVGEPSRTEASPSTSRTAPAQTNAETGSGPDTEPDTELESGPVAETDAESGPDAEPAADIAPETAAQTAAEPAPETAAQTDQEAGR